MSKHLMTSCIWYFGLIGVSVWLIGFCLFCLYACSFRPDPHEQTDAIIVLTGGNERVQTALNLLQEKYADHLLISGVHKDVTLADLASSVPPELMPNITLGYRAKDTRGHAAEIADWIRRHAVRRVLLVTSFYHMPRSIFEVSHKNPELQIMPLPVFPRSFGDSVDWIRTRYAWLLFVEYHKFMATWAQNKIERILK